MSSSTEFHADLTQISETFSYMRDIMETSINTEMPPDKAMHYVVENFRKSEAQSTPTSAGFNGQRMGPGQGQQQSMQMNMQRNSSVVSANGRGSMQFQGQLGAMGQSFGSPAMSQQHPGMMNQLNGVPMNGSPLMHGIVGQGGVMNFAPMQGAGDQMNGPNMIPQQSQQGTNSSVGSIDASPNNAALPNSASNKRRRSQIKAEGDDGPDAPQAKTVKASPRPGTKGRK